MEFNLNNFTVLSVALSDRDFMKLTLKLHFTHIVESEGYTQHSHTAILLMELGLNPCIPLILNELINKQVAIENENAFIT